MELNMVQKGYPQKNYLLLEMWTQLSPNTWLSCFQWIKIICLTLTVPPPYSTNQNKPHVSYFLIWSYFIQLTWNKLERKTQHIFFPKYPNSPTTNLCPTPNVIDMSSSAPSTLVIGTSSKQIWIQFEWPQPPPSLLTLPCPLFAPRPLPLPPLTSRLLVRPQGAQPELNT